MRRAAPLGCRRVASPEVAPWSIETTRSARPQDCAQWSSRRSTLNSSSRMGSWLSHGDERRALSKALRKKTFNLTFLPRDRAAEDRRSGIRVPDAARMWSPRSVGGDFRSDRKGGNSPSLGICSALLRTPGPSSSIGSSPSCSDICASLVHRFRGSTHITRPDRFCRSKCERRDRGWPPRWRRGFLAQFLFGRDANLAKRGPGQF